jgi:DNA-binding transcriptional MerR regulator
VSLPAEDRATLSIGEVLARLRRDFGDVSISKIRFLETEGLVTPSRSASGYRKFAEGDVERLRYVLRMQRDHYLPLRVIREHLEAIDRGLEPPALVDGGPRAPRLVAAAPDQLPMQEMGSDLRLAKDELLEATGLTEEQLATLESYGLLGPRAGSWHYDGTALAIARAVAELTGFGLEPRHLRAFKVAADREVGLVEAVITPLLRQRDPDARTRAIERAGELALRSAQLHVALVRAGVAKVLGTG